MNRIDAESETLLPVIHSETGKGWWSEGVSALRADPGGMPSHVVTHALKSEGHDASEDGTGRGVPLVPVAYRTSGNCGAWETGDKTDAITTATDRASQIIAQPNAVRRLLPIECEKLQGFPPGYTNIPGAADGPRYKALGNSMAVPCMAWIGRRIMTAIAQHKESNLCEGSTSGS